MIIDVLSNTPPAKASQINISRPEGGEFAAFLMAMTEAWPMPGESRDHASGSSEPDVEAQNESTVFPDPDDAGPAISASGQADTPDHEGHGLRADTEPAPGAGQPEPGAAIAPSGKARIGGGTGATEPPVSTPSAPRPGPESHAPAGPTAAPTPVPSGTAHPALRRPADAAAPAHRAPLPAGGDSAGRGVTGDLPLPDQGEQGQGTRGSRAPIARPLPAPAVPDPSASPQDANPAPPRRANVEVPALRATGSGASTAILQAAGQSTTWPATNPAPNPAPGPVRGPIPAADDTPESARTSPVRAGFNAIGPARPPAPASGMPPPRLAGTEAPMPGAHPPATLKMPAPASTATPVSTTPLATGGAATAPTRRPLAIEPFAALQGAEAPRSGHADRSDGRAVLASGETPLPGGPAPAAATQADAAMRSTIETARHTAQQIAARAVDLGHGRLELSLSPAELGKVDMLLQDGENRLTLFISAERPETMDLIRRHISLLEQELRQMGLGTLSLELGNGGSTESGPGHGSDSRRSTHGAAPAPALPPERTPSRIAGDHLDLRM